MKGSYTPNIAGTLYTYLEPDIQWKIISGMMRSYSTEYHLYPYIYTELVVFAFVIKTNGDYENTKHKQAALPHKAIGGAHRASALLDYLDGKML